MSIEAGIADVLSIIKITREKYEEHVVSCTKLVAGEKAGSPVVPQLIHESLRYEEGVRYVVFGADKCAVSDVRKFFDLLNIDYQDLLDATAKYPLGTDSPLHCNFRGYLLCSRNKDLCINVTSNSSKDGYFHYMNVTAEETAGLKAFQAFQTLGSHSGQCWGGYW